MGQINIGKQNVHNAPPSGACAYTFNADGKPGYVDSSGVFTLLGESGTSTTNLYASLGVGLSSALPESPEIGDTFVTTDTLQLYTRIDSVTWSFIDLPSQAFVTDTTGDRAVLYQRIGTVLVVISSDTYDSITINGNMTISGTVDGRDVAEDGEKLDGIEEGAQVNVNADWNSVSGDSQILNKPTDVTDLSTHASSELSDGSNLVKNAGTSINNAIARFDGTTGKLVQSSSTTIDDDGNITINNDSPIIFFRQTDTGNKGRFTLGGDGFNFTWVDYAIDSFISQPFEIKDSAPTHALRIKATEVTSVLNINIAAGKTYQINGTQITSLALSDGADLVKGPATSTDNAIARYDGITGKVVQNSPATLDDDGNIAGLKDTSTETVIIDSAVQMSYDSVNEELKFTFL